MKRIFMNLLAIALFVSLGISGCSGQHRSFQEMKRVFQTNSVHYRALEMIENNKVPDGLKVDYLTNFNTCMALRSRNRDINQKMLRLFDEKNNPDKVKMLEKLRLDNEETAVSILRQDSVLDRIAMEILGKPVKN